MDEDMIKELLNKIAQTNEEKTHVLEWVTHELVCQTIEMKIPSELRRKYIQDVISYQLDKWVD